MMDVIDTSEGISWRERGRLSSHELLDELCRAMEVNAEVARVAALRLVTVLSRIPNAGRYRSKFAGVWRRGRCARSTDI